MNEYKIKSIVLTQKQLQAIGKAVSSIRFTANNWEWLTDAARNESLLIANILVEIESECIGFD